MNESENKTPHSWGVVSAVLVGNVWDSVLPAEDRRPHPSALEHADLKTRREGQSLMKLKTETR